MDTNTLVNFLILARTNTYAGNTGEVKSVLSGHKQYEFTDGDWVYRDMYVVGNGRFVGTETVYLKSKPVWGMSYFGNFSAMTEEGADTILRKAMSANVAKTRLWHKVAWNDGEFTYHCEGIGDNIEEIRGTEDVVLSGAKLYYFTYAGGLIG